MSVKHVTMLTNAVAPDKLGGLERYVRELAASLVGAGVRVTVLTKRVTRDQPLQETGSDGVEIVRHVVPKKSNPAFAVAYPFSVALGIKKSVARNPGTLFHAHFPVPALWPSLRGLDYAYTFHAPVYKEILDERSASYTLPACAQGPAVAALKKAEAHVLRRARSVVVLSEFSRSELQLLDREVAECAQIVPGGVDTEWFAPDSAERVPGALFAARRLTPRAGVLELIRAMAIIVRAIPGTHLTIAGEGQIRQEVEAEILRLRLSEHVDLIGRVGDEELRRRYRTSVLSIVPSQALEGFGLSTAESLSVGTPVVVTPIGANIEVAGRVDPALVAKDRSPEGIADCVVKLLTTPGLLDRVSARCRARVAPAYSWPTVVEQHLELYERMADAG